MTFTPVTVGGLTIGNDRPLTVIAGPCQLEGADHAQMIAGRMKEICDACGAQYVFKASYDKANRTSLSGKRGPGIDDGLKLLQQVGKAIGVPTLTDVHTEAQCAPAAEAVDVLQIPAFLSRQTDLLVAAAEVTPMDRIDVAERQLSELTNVMGIVLNRCRYNAGAHSYEGEYY